jgi:hypothetical protein
LSPFLRVPARGGGSEAGSAFALLHSEMVFDCRNGVFFGRPERERVDSPPT